MSVRSYDWGGRAPSRSRRPAHWMSLIPVWLAVATVALQIAYPLTEADIRTQLTVVTVVTFFLASALHALVWRGAAWTFGFLLVTVGGGWLVEAVGSSRGVPFGAYDYTDSLGAQVFGVPWVIPLAWSMMAYPALLVARRLVQRPWAVALVGGLALAAWDLFLDPMMVADGHWIWSDPTPSLIGVPGIPVTNFIGWLAVAVIMMSVLALLPQHAADDRVPLALWLWVYFSSILANAVFLDRPSVALVGGVVMGVVAVPLLVSLWAERP